jgi:hypothetical protein
MRKIVILLILLTVLSHIASAATLTVEYSASSPSLCKKYCVYKNEPAYTVGLGSSTATAINDSPMSITATVTEENDDALIILTEKNTVISNREAFLKEKTLPTLINPSFGFPIKDIFSVMLSLQYAGIYMSSVALDNGIGPGTYSLMLKNNGTISSGPHQGSTEVVIEVI